MRPIITILFATSFSVLSGAGCYASTNDSVPALTQALSELPPDRSVLDLAEGTYTIASTWDIPRAGVTIRGAGIGKTILVRDPQFSGVMVNMNGENGTITGLTLDGGETAKEVLFFHKPGGIADAIEVKNFRRIGIAVAATDCTINKCLVTGLGDNVANQGMGIWRDAGKTDISSKLTVSNCTIKNNELNGIYATGGIINILNNTLTGNHVYAPTGGGQIDIGNAFSTNTAATITGNTIVNGGGIKAGGIELGGGNFTVTNNIIRNHGGSSIGIGHNVIGATIEGNTISNSGHNTADKNKPQARAGIYVGYGATSVKISGNRCFDDQPDKTQTWGIILVGPPARPDPRFSARAIEHVIVKGNDLRGNIHPKGLLDQSGARDRLVSGNLPAEANR